MYQHTHPAYAVGYQQSAGQQSAYTGLYQASYSSVASSAAISVPQSFLQQIGVGPSDGDLLFLGELAWQSQLPPRFTAHYDESFREYYYVNSDSDASQWEHPLVPYLRQLIDLARLLRSGEFCMTYSDIVSLFKSALEAELAAWFGPFYSEQNEMYFVNSSRTSSSWHDPRVDAECIHTLQRTLLDQLQFRFPIHRLSSRFANSIPSLASPTYLSAAPVVSPGASSSPLDDTHGTPKFGATLRDQLASSISHASLPSFGLPSPRVSPVAAPVVEQPPAELLESSLTFRPDARSVSTFVSAKSPKTPVSSDSPTESLNSPTSPSRGSAFLPREEAWETAEASDPISQRSLMVDRDFHEANDRMQHVLQQERDAKRAELLAKARTRRLAKDVKLTPLAPPEEPRSPASPPSPATAPPASMAVAAPEAAQAAEKRRRKKPVEDEFAIDFLKLP